MTYHFCKKFHKFPITVAAFCLALQVIFPQGSVLAQIKRAEGLVVTNSTLGFPEAKARAPRYTIKVLTTAYSSTPDQTDSTPFITAANTQVRPGVVAANFLPFGTKLRLPKHFPDQTFVVEDRMHQRFSERIDIWMETREAAKQWGTRYITVEVL